MNATSDNLQPLNVSARAAGEQARLQVVTAPSSGSRAFMLSDLARSGLQPEDVGATVINTVTSGFVSAPVGYRLPYFDLYGKPHANMYRERLAEGAQRYRQPSRDEVGDDCTHPYIPPSIHSMDCATIAICEGEKKAASVVKHIGIPAIGIGGCGNWRAGSKQIAIHPTILALLKLRNVRRVLIIPDADVQRYDLAKEYGTFATQLKAEGLEVELLNPPGKIDDLIVQWGEHSRGQFGQLPRVASLVENARSLADRYGLAAKTSASGTVTLEQNVANVLMLLRQHPAFPVITYNADTLQIEFDGSPIHMDREGTDVLTFLQHNLQMPKVSPTTVRIALVRHAFDKTRHPFRDWLKTLRWDGVPRLEQMFNRYCGSPDSEFVREVGRKWLAGAVWRAMEPGCPLDYMLITQGAQGRGKSTFPTILWGSERVVTVLGSEMQQKDDLIKFHMGKCISFEEFDTMRISDIGHLKGVITNRIDTFRKPYDADTKHHHRACVFYASTNKRSFLKRDDTGYRRFVVVPFAQLQFEALAADREQLWAEADYIYRQLRAEGRLHELSEVRGTTEAATEYVNEEDYITLWNEWLADELAHRRRAIQYTDGHLWLKTAEIHAISGAKSLEAKSALKEYLQSTGWRYMEKASRNWTRDGKRLERVWIYKLP